MTLPGNPAEADPFKVASPEELGSHINADISAINASRLQQLHRRDLEQQVLADPSDPTRIIPNEFAAYVSMTVNEALSLYFDNHPLAFEITQSALLATGSKPPEDLFI